jgi:ArsR family transcriptional regulator
MTQPTLDELDLLHTHICRALADPKRLLILYALDEQPRHVTALAEALELPQPTVSRHLRVLREQYLVNNERNGPAMIYSLTDPRIIAVLDAMRQIMNNVLRQHAAPMGGS